MHKLRKLIALLGVVVISSTLVVSTATAAGEWYEPFMQNLVDVGVDFGDPGTNATRCEWTQGVVAWNALEAELPTEATFLDVPVGNDCFEAVEIAYAHGVVNGYSDSEGAPTGYFGPADPVTREQAAKLTVEGEDLPVVEDSGLFPDESSFSSWATDAWYHSTVFAWNKMVGDSDTGMFRPGDDILHAEAAKVITIGAELSASYVADDVVPDDVVSEGDLLVELSADTPAGDTVPSKATSVEAAMWDFTATGGDVVLDLVKIHTHGVTSLPSGHALYLYEGADRLTSGKSVNSSTNLANFSNLNLLIKEGETLTLTLKVDVGTASATAEMGFEIEEAAHVDASDGVVTGDFPLQGDTFGISTTSAGTLTIEKNGTISNPKVGEDDVVVAKFKMSAATEAAEVEQLGLLVTGTISNDAVQDFELYVSGETDPIATVSGLNSKDLAVFVLDTPYVITKGDTKAFTMKASFNTGRSADTVKVYVDETTDVLALGGTYGFGMAVDINNSSGYDGTTAACTSSSGTCSYSALEGGDVTISSSGPTAADIGTAADDVRLLDFSVVSVSDVTFKNFPISLTGTEGAGDTTEGLLNATASNFTDIKIINVDTGETLMGPIDANVLVTASAGSTAITEADGDDAQAYYLFTDEFDMAIGEELNLAITADVANTATLDGMTLIATLDLGATYPQIKDVNNKTVTNASSLVPASAITGKTMTVSTPSLVLSLAAVPASITHIKGEAGVKFTGISAKCGAASACKITDVLLQGYLDDSGTADDWTTDGIGDDNATYLNEYVGSAWLEDSTGGILAASQSVESDGDVQFNNMTWQLDAGETTIFYVVGNISSDAYKNSDGENIAFGIETAGDVDYEDDDGNTRDSTGTPNNEGTATTDPSTFVTISDGGSLTVSVDSSTPNEDIVVAGTADQEISSFKFTTTDEAFVVTQLSINNRQSGVTTALLGDYDDNVIGNGITISYVNSDGDTETKTSSLVKGTAQFSGMDFYIGKDDDAVLTVLATLNTITAGADAGTYVDLNVAFNNFESVAQSSGETYKGDKIDEDVGATSDLDFGTMTWVAGNYDINTAVTTLAGLGSAQTLIVNDSHTGDTDPGNLPVGTLLCVSADATCTNTAESIMVVTAWTEGTAFTDVGDTGDSVATLVLNNDDTAFADADNIIYALPGSGYLTNAKQMHVYKSVPVLALASSSPSGSRTVSQDDTIYEFNITPDANDDVIIRQGLSGDDENDVNDVASGIADGEATITTTAGDFIDGSGGVSIVDTADYVAGDAFLLDETYSSGAINAYNYASFWMKVDEVDDDSDVDFDGISLALDDDTTPSEADAGEKLINLGSTTLAWANGVQVTTGQEFTDDTWVLFTVDISAAVDADLQVGFEIANTNDLDINDAIFVDGFVFHNEMLVVDLSSNARFDTTPSNGGDADSIVQCELYQGTTVKATAGAGVSTSSAAKVLIVPENNISGTDYADIEISKGVSTKYSVVCDSMDLITPSVNDDLLTPSINYGSSTNGTVTRGSFWWSADEATKTLVYWLGDVGIKLSGNTLKY